MAIVNTLGYTAKPKDPLYGNGIYPRIVQAAISITSGAADGDVHILARNLPYSAKIIGIRFPFGSAVVTDLTDVDFGLHRSDNNAVVDKDILVDGISFASARAYAIDILSADKTKTIAELLGVSPESEPLGGVNVTATVNTQGAGVGTIEAEILIQFPA